MMIKKKWPSVLDSFAPGFLALGDNIDIESNSVCLVCPTQFGSMVIILYAFFTGMLEQLWLAPAPAPYVDDLL